jgi:uncharacterized membrane protein
MNAISWLIGGLAGGCGLTMLVDPTRGRRRRALIRDTMVSAAHAIGDAVDTTSRDVRNRTRGIIVELRARGSREPVSDAVLSERVRARLGGLVRHSRSIEVSAQQGRVTLCGPVLSDEVETLLRGVARVPGVGEVDNRLEVHDEPGQVPGLQGASRRRQADRFELMQTKWSPTARLLVTLAGASVTLAGARRRGLTGAFLAAGGLTLLARATTNLELKRLFGIGAGRRALTIQKTITVAAPIEEVFELWSHYESFPRFMAHVRNVRRSADGRARWTVAGPAGVPLEWQTEETLREAPFRLAWKTVEGSPIAHAGIVHFEPEAAGTRIHVQMHYNPPGGAVGHALGTLLGADPRRALDGDLLRFKSLLEDGKTSVGRRTVTRDDVVR